MRARPLLWTASCFSAGAFLGLDLGAARPWACGLLAAAALGLWAWSRRPAGALLEDDDSPSAAALLAAVLCAAALGVLRTAPVQAPVKDPLIDRWLEDAAAARGGREPLLVEGTVESSDLGPAGTRLVVRLTAREPRPLLALEALPVPVGALLAGPPGLHSGDRFRGLVHLKTPGPARNPGQDDQLARLARRGLAYTGTLDAQDLVVLSRGGLVAAALDRLRARFAERCRELCTTAQRAALVAALGAGDRSGLDPATDEALSASGLVHLLASAGLHLAAAAWLGRALAQRLLERLPMASNRSTRGLAALTGLACAGLQAALLGGPWPALRAAAAAAILLCGPLLERKSDGLTLLATSAAACALWDPSALHEPALQLSLLGVFGLLVAAPRLRELWPWRAPPEVTLRTRPVVFLLEEVTRLFFASLAATLCCAPLLAATFHKVSLVAPLANAVALGPGLAALPLASLLVVLDAALPAVTLPLFWLCDGLAGLVLALSGWFAALPFALVRPAAPTLLQVLLWALFVTLLCGLPGPLGARLHPSRPRPRTRLLRAAVPALLLCLHHEALAAGNGHLSATFLSVGQGDCALLRFPGGAAVLIDAGGDLRGLPAPLGKGLLDPGTRDVLPALAALGVSRLELVVLTHPHPDHAGGLPSVLRALPVGALWMTSEPGPGDLGGAIRQVAEGRGVPVHEPAPGERFTSGGASLEVLAPDPRWSPSRSTNDNSIVLRVDHGAVSLLFAGDAEALEEAALAHGPRRLRAHLLKAGHHGSRTSTTDALLRAVSPETVVFSAGLQNPFGFPHPEVVARTRAAGARVFTTAESAVLAESDGVKLEVKAFAPP